MRTPSILKRRDRAQGLPGPRQLPISQQLVAVKLEPLEHVAQRAPRELAGHLAVLDLDRDLVLAVRRVEVRRIVVAVQDGDRDPQEPANDGHDLKLHRGRWAA